MALRVPGMNHGTGTMIRSNPFSFDMEAAPESRCAAHVAGGEIRVHVVVWAMVRPACGAVAGMARLSPIA